MADLSMFGQTTRDVAHRYILSGSGGLGKTSLAAEFPSPVFIFTESGYGDLGVHAWKNGKVVESYAEIFEPLQFLHQGEHNFQTVVIDSADHFEPMVLAATLAQHGVSDLSEIAWGQGMARLVDNWKPITQWLDVLREHRQMNVVIISHVDQRKVEPPGELAYDRYDLKLQRKTAAYLTEWADNIFFLGWETFQKTEKSGFNGERVISKGTGRRIIHTIEAPAYIAKNRFSLEPKIPYVKGEGYTAIAKAMSGEPTNPQSVTTAPVANLPQQKQA